MDNLIGSVVITIYSYRQKTLFLYIIYLTSGAENSLKPSQGLWWIYKTYLGYKVALLLKLLTYTTKVVLKSNTVVME